MASPEMPQNILHEWGVDRYFNPLVVRAQPIIVVVSERSNLRQESFQTQSGSHYNKQVYRKPPINIASVFGPKDIGQKKVEIPPDPPHCS